MHLLHRSSVLGAGNNKNKALRRVGSSPRAPPPRLMMSRSDSIKKRSGGNGKKGGGGGAKHPGSKRARLRAGLAAALQELRLAAGHRKRGGEGVSDTTKLPAAQVGAPCRTHGVATPAERSDAEPAATASSRALVPGGVSVLPLVLLVLALACVVALGRAPAVCCCTCAAWWCRATAAVDERRPAAILCSGEVRRRQQAGASRINNGTARQRS